MNEMERCINNIKFFAKMKDINIGTLETMIGVSKGYFSRYTKREWKRMPVVVLYKVSEILGVDVDSLFRTYEAKELAAVMINVGKCTGVGVDYADNEYKCYIMCKDEKIIVANHIEIMDALHELEQICLLK